MSLLQYYIQTERTASSTCLLVILDKNNTLLNFHYYRKKTSHCIFTTSSTLLPDNKFLIWFYPFNISRQPQATTVFIYYFSGKRRMVRIVCYWINGGSLEGCVVARWGRCIGPLRKIWWLIGNVWWVSGENAGSTPYFYGTTYTSVGCLKLVYTSPQEIL
jgi:hypothetical protein